MVDWAHLNLAELENTPPPVPMYAWQNPCRLEFVFVPPDMLKKKQVFQTIR
jgi:hypothetical protein